MRLIGLYKTTAYHTRPYKTMVDHMRLYKIIQDYRRPYKTIEDHIRLCNIICDYRWPLGWLRICFFWNFKMNTSPCLTHVPRSLLIFFQNFWNAFSSSHFFSNFQKCYINKIFKCFIILWYYIQNLRKKMLIILV